MLHTPPSADAPARPARFASAGTSALRAQSVPVRPCRKHGTTSPNRPVIYLRRLSGNRRTLREIELMDNDVDTLHAQIITYLGKISRLSLTEKQTATLMRLMAAVNDLENIGDVVETNLIVLGRERIDAGVSISGPTRQVLMGFHQVVTRSVAAAVQAVAQNNELAARSVTSMKQEIQHIADSAAIHQAQRLVAEEPNRIPAYTIEIDIIEKLKRIYYFAKRMAKTVETDEEEDGAS
ncbi:PhoU domain-containing protein [Thiocapsa rosea]|uniref:PhoU domain-containing protein n=1 Tax=Thiocapsa rosea TaxID=69360 RepID=UPI001FE861D0|nr:PhoU domain-containing protein [Thiocapsa rosea]